MTREELLALNIFVPNGNISRKIKEAWNKVAKPLDGLGKLETMICRIGAAQDCVVPEISPRAVLVMCADNGIVREGVSQSGQEVTLAVAHNMGRLKSSVCKMARIARAEVITVDIGINSGEEIPGVLDRKVCPGTRDFLEEPAMTEEEVLQAVETGILMVKDCAERGIRILATGEMGIGNTTTSTAVTAAILGLPAKEITGKGAGLSEGGICHKAEVITKGLLKYGFEKRCGETDDRQAERERCLKILQCVGGLDIAGLCGVFIGGALYHVPVVIDGLISAAAALCADGIVPGCREFMLASHAGAETGMEYILQHLGLTEVIRADLALGEGTGAVMLFPLLDMAMEVFRGSSTFEEIGVEQYRRHGS